MASFKKLPSGKWQAQVSKKGLRKSASFPTKREAQDWAARQEYLINTHSNPKTANLVFRDLFKRYGREESPKRRGERWELIRINSFSKDAIADIKLSQLGPSDLADWRNRRLKNVSAGTVRREMNMLSSILSIAVREWQVLSENPIKDVRKPPSPQPRNRRVSDAEIELLLSVSGTNLSKATARAIHAFRFAIETGMRAGEVLSLHPGTVDIENRVATLPMTKNGTAREVPLSKKSIELLKALPEREGSFFGLKSAQLDILFRKTRDKTDIENLHFHDSRHEAITRMARKIDILSLARIIGHKDLKMLMVYYNESAADIAARLD